MIIGWSPDSHSMPSPTSAINFLTVHLSHWTLLDQDMATIYATTTLPTVPRNVCRCLCDQRRPNCFLWPTIEVYNGKIVPRLSPAPREPKLMPQIKSYFFFDILPDRNLNWFPHTGSTTKDPRKMGFGPRKQKTYDVEVGMGSDWASVLAIPRYHHQCIHCSTLPHGSKVEWDRLPIDMPLGWRVFGGPRKVGCLFWTISLQVDKIATCFQMPTKVLYMRFWVGFGWKHDDNRWERNSPKRATNHLVLCLPSGFYLTDLCVLGVV